MKKALGSLVTIFMLSGTAWAQWQIDAVIPHPPPLPQIMTGGVDTAVMARTGQEYCMGLSLIDGWGPFGTNVEVWCEDSGGYFTRQNQLPVFNFSTVDVEAEHWAGSDIDAPSPSTWYGPISGTPQLASSVASPSLSLSHYSNGNPLLVHGGLPPNNHVYLTAYDGTSWTTSQLTNNFTSSSRLFKSIAATISGDTLHIAYWDATYSALRYAQKAPGATWTFETLITVPSAPYDLWPSVAVNAAGGPIVVFPMYDGTIRVFERAGPAGVVWTQETLTDPAGAAVVYRTVAAETMRDRILLLYVTYNSSTNKTELRYRKRVAGAWSTPEQLMSVTNMDLIYGLSMDLKDSGFGLPIGPHIGFVYDLSLGVVFHGVRTTP